MLLTLEAMDALIAGAGGAPAGTDHGGRHRAISTPNVLVDGDRGAASEAQS
ncbi:hypothetical protein ACFZA9_30540 [Streptomyces olivaceus]|uniref:hypothetical protein n=1 Tax=Streptomyces olivaceus TaxID=47716 RepID=UPI0036ED5043